MQYATRAGVFSKSCRLSAMVVLWASEKKEELKYEDRC